MVSVVIPSSITSTFVTSQLTGQLNSTAPYWDACTAGGTALASIGPGLLAFANESGGWTVGYLHPSGIIGSPISGLPSAATINSSGTDTVTGPIAVTLDKSNGSAVVVLVTTPGIGTLQQVYANFLTPSTLSNRLIGVRVGNVAHVVQRAACEFASVQVGGNSVLWWAFETSNGTSSRPDLHVVWSGSATVAGVSQAAQSLRGHCLYSRAFADATDVYALLVHSPQFFTYYATVRLSDPNFGVNGKVVCVARSQPGACPGAGTNALATSVNPVSPDATFASRTHAVCLGDRIQLSGSSGTQFSESGIRLCTYEFAAATAYQTAQLGAGLYLAGALLQHYDGSRWAEADFHCAPDVASGTTIGSQTTGGSIADDTYGYKIIYEEIDAQGELHPGAVGVAFNVVVVNGSGSAAVTLALPTYRLTGKTMVRIGVFRSPGNSTGDDITIPYYRVTGTDVTVQTGNNCYVVNNPSLDTVTFVDGMSDATLKTQEPLYTNGGILSNDPITCAGGVIATGGSRLFWTDPSDPNLVNFSQQLRADTAMEASPALSQLTDPYGGEVVALGVMDAVIYALKETAIYGFGGPGPDANPDSASGNAFTPSQLITSDVGCTSPSSVAQSPAGIVFHSSKGIMLLDRSRQVEDIGSAVYAYKDQPVTRATLRPDRHEILFLTDAGATLLWDYQYKQWSQFTNHNGLDAVVVDGIYNYLRNDGRVFAETIGAYSDAGAHIPIRIDTAWIKAAGYLQGFQKVVVSLRARQLPLRPHAQRAVADRLPGDVVTDLAAQPRRRSEPVALRRGQLRRGQLRRQRATGEHRLPEDDPPESPVPVDRVSLRGRRDDLLEHDARDLRNAGDAAHRIRDGAAMEHARGSRQPQ